MEIKILRKIINDTKKIDAIQRNELSNRSLYSLQRDIDNNFFTVVVLGEFKRGKSTFVNALLGTPLLPMNILPETATINAIMYSENPQLSVVYMDGRQEAGEPTYEFLQNFSAQKNNEERLNKIKYIKIGYPLDILKNRIVLVDTPGVSDLNQQRCDITYRFLPKANAVLFLLDANSPLKKSEKEFIEKQLFPLGLKDIVFLVNKYDCIDEEEEDDDFLDEIKARLSETFHVGEKGAALDDIILYPLSARDALDGIAENDLNRVKASGLPEVQESLRKILNHGDLENKKIKSYQMRLQNILSHAIRSLKSLRTLKKMDIDTLKKACDSLESIQAERIRNEKNIRIYAEHNKENICMMADKSILYFQKRLSEEIIASVETYRGEDFKEYVEQNVMRRIRYNLESWIRTYSACIDTSLTKMSQEMAHGISWYFKTKIRIETRKKGKLRPIQEILSVEADDVSVVDTQIRIAAGVGYVGLLAIMGSTIMPLIGVAAIPYFRKKMLKNRLEEAKAEVIPSLEEVIADSITHLQKEVHTYIDQQTEQIIGNTEYAYRVLVQQLQDSLHAELVKKQASTNNVENELKRIDDDIISIRKLYDSLVK
jgi:GTPase Era involved in 16S rRNA processing